MAFAVTNPAVNPWRGLGTDIARAGMWGYDKGVEADQRRRDREFAEVMSEAPEATKEAERRTSPGPISTPAMEAIPTGSGDLPDHTWTTRQATDWQTRMLAAAGRTGNAQNVAAAQEYFSRHMAKGFSDNITNAIAALQMNDPATAMESVKKGYAYILDGNVPQMQASADGKQIMMSVYDENTGESKGIGVLTPKNLAELKWQVGNPEGWFKFNSEFNETVRHNQAQEQHWKNQLTSLDAYRKMLADTKAASASASDGGGGSSSGKGAGGYNQKDWEKIVQQEIFGDGSYMGTGGEGVPGAALPYAAAVGGDELHRFLMQNQAPLKAAQELANTIWVEGGWPDGKGGKIPIPTPGGAVRHSFIMLFHAAANEDTDPAAKAMADIFRSQHGFDPAMLKDVLPAHWRPPEEEKEGAFKKIWDLLFSPTPEEAGPPAPLPRAEAGIPTTPYALPNAGVSPGPYSQAQTPPAGTRFMPSTPPEAAQQAGVTPPPTYQPAPPPTSPAPTAVPAPAAAPAITPSVPPAAAQRAAAAPVAQGPGQLLQGRQGPAVGSEDPLGRPTPIYDAFTGVAEFFDNLFRNPEGAPQDPLGRQGSIIGAVGRLMDAVGSQPEAANQVTDDIAAATVDAVTGNDDPMGRPQVIKDIGMGLAELFGDLPTATAPGYEGEPDAGPSALAGAAQAYSTAPQRQQAFDAWLKQPATATMEALQSMPTAPGYESNLFENTPYGTLAGAAQAYSVSPEVQARIASLNAKQAREAADSLRTTIAAMRQSLQQRGAAASPTGLMAEPAAPSAIQAPSVPPHYSGAVGPAQQNSNGMRMLLSKLESVMAELIIQAGNSRGAQRAAAAGGR